MPSRAQQDSLRRILEELEAGPALSQRALAERLGIALGRANQLLKTLVDSEWIEIGREAGQRRTYSVTPAGARARKELTREFLGRTVESFLPARNRVRDCLAACAAGSGCGESAPAGRPAIVMHAPDAIAHIGFACAVEAGVNLVGFVADGPRRSLLGLPVRPWSDLTPAALDGQRLDWLMIASLSDPDDIRDRLKDIGFPLDRVSWL